MLKRSIAISCILIIFASYFDSSVGKKLFAKNATTSCVQAARICLLVNMAINSPGTLNTKLIFSRFKSFYVKWKAKRKELQKWLKYYFKL